jgi:preprotein translocase subunit SecB
MTEETQGASNGQAAQPSFQIKRIYLKDISFETPMGVEAFNKTWKPQISQELNVQVTNLEANHVEVILLLTITAKIEDKVVFLIEVKQAGIFVASGVASAQLNHVVNTTCPQILFPYAREAIDSTLARGSFPPLMLPPINFDAIFAQAMAQQAKQQAGQAAPTSTSIN